MGHGPKKSSVVVESFLASPEVQAQQAANIALCKAATHQVEHDADKAAIYHAMGEYAVEGLAVLAESKAPGMGDLLRSTFRDSLKAVQDA